MSDHGAPSPRDESSESSATRTSRPTLNYEFVDSQDPNTRSQIQRHTAHHAAQQRREAARQRLLSETSTSRLFEWQRRPDADNASPTTSSSIAGSVPRSPLREASIATVPANCSSVSVESIQKHDVTSSPTEQLPPVTMTYNNVEEALLKYCKLSS
jgi:hypothetical protein